MFKIILTLLVLQHKLLLFLIRDFIATNKRNLTVVYSIKLVNDFKRY